MSSALRAYRRGDEKMNDAGRLLIAAFRVDRPSEALSDPRSIAEALVGSAWWAATAERIEQRLQSVVVDFQHQREQPTKLAWREAFAGEPGKVIAGKVGEDAALVFAVGHFAGDEEVQELGIHARTCFIRRHRRGCLH